MRKCNVQKTILGTQIEINDPATIITMNNFFVQQMDNKSK